jgi:hypothetical protein
MIYLLDTSVLVQAKDAWYPMHRFHQIWKWLELKAAKGQIKIPREILNEINVDNDPLTDWVVRNKRLLIVDEPILHLDQIYKTGYLFEEPPRLTDTQTIGNDPFLVSYCMNDITNRVVVSAEKSKPERCGKNRKIPDVCDKLGVKHCYMEQVLEDLDFVEE